VRTSDAAAIREHLLRLRGEPVLPPEASVVIPINARKDLINVLQIIGDITAYQGKHRLEIVLVINNYHPNSPPKEIEEFRALGLVVLAIPKLLVPRETIFSARIPGVRAASSEKTIHFDADCRVPHATHLIDWYIEQFDRGAQLAYTYVGYYDLPTSLSSKVWIMIHRAFRWFKRVILRIPVSRGSNYAVIRSLILHLYDKGWLSYDIKVGTMIKSIGGKISYSGEKNLMVLTSGRNFRGNWKESFEYTAWRMGYYRRLAPLRPDADYLKEDSLTVDHENVVTTSVVPPKSG